jgi:hypothetical protein
MLDISFKRILPVSHHENISSNDKFLAPGHDFPSDFLINKKKNTTMLLATFFSLVCCLSCVFCLFALAYPLYTVMVFLAIPCS